MDTVSMLIGHKAGAKAARDGVLIGITRQPQNVTAKEGDTVTFSVAALGENLTYQWQFYSDGWRATTVTGNKTDTITLEATAARNGNQYRCNVTSTGGAVTSAAATLTVEEEPEPEPEPEPEGEGE